MRDAESDPVRERIPGSIPEKLLDVAPCEVPDERPKLVKIRVIVCAPRPRP
ncbi:hypothetical protein [Streptomyces sp. NPDC020141]|uniref:hypothetical protein n=1 Tax=Streptomyces sp. NPDC020141 TaxID=3365065 RepID=UPI0037B4D311